MLFYPKQKKRLDLNRGLLLTEKKNHTGDIIPLPTRQTVLNSAWMIICTSMSLTGFTALLVLWYKS